MKHTCQHAYDCDPGDMFAKYCVAVATRTVLFSLRNGETEYTVDLCDFHADYDAESFNRWGKPYGHVATIGS